MFLTAACTYSCNCFNHRSGHCKGDDPRAPGIAERREYWILVSTVGSVQDLVRDHIKIFGSGEATDKNQFENLMSHLCAPSGPKWCSLSFPVYCMCLLLRCVTSRNISGHPVATQTVSAWEVYWLVTVSLHG